MFKYTVQNVVTLPHISMAALGLYFFKITGLMQARKDSEDPVVVMHVIDLKTGLEGEVVPGLLLREALDNRYPKDTYVGRSFRIEKVPGGRSQGGRNYYRFHVVEITVDETAVDETAVDETAVDETAVDETVVNETVVNETVVNKTVVNEVAEICEK